MEELKKDGFTFVLHTFSEFDLMFNAQTMKDIFEITHKAGLDVWVNPWGIGNVFGGEPFSNFASKNIFTSCQVLDDGNPTPIACPNSTEFIKFMESWVDAVIDAGVDTILWDEPHFHEQGFLSSIPGRWGCSCNFCKNKFEKEFNEPFPKSETNELKQFKKNSIVEFIKKLSERAKNGNVNNTLYLTGNIKSELMEKEWQCYFEIDSIDTLSTGPYWHWAKESVSQVSDFSKTLLQISSKNNKNTQIWIQGFKISAGREEEVSDAIEMALNSGVSNIAIWGYEGCSQQSWVRSDNPTLTWQNVLSAIQKIKT